MQAQILPAVYQGLVLDIQPLVAPSIITQPEGATVHAGTNVALRVVAAGSEPLRYQWEHAQQPIVGAINSTLELASIREDQAGDYRVRVTNGGGVVTSDTATLTVLPALSLPAIERQPEPAFASVGENVAFSVAATGSGPLLYQWQRQNTDLPGRTSATLVLEDVQIAQAGNYRVIVRNPIGTVTSQSASLTVSATPRAILIGSLDATAGSNIELPVELRALGDENAVSFSLTFDPAQLQYRGLRRGAPAQGTVLNLNDKAVAEGRIGVAVTKPPGQRFSSGTAPLVFLQFRVGRTPGQTALLPADTPVQGEIVDVRGRVRPSEVTGGTINILDTPPAIVSAPVDMATRLFSPFTLEVAASGSTPMFYQWLFNGEPVTGATSPTYSIAEAMPGNSGDYQVIVSNAVDVVTSAPARLEVRRVVQLSGTNTPTGTTIEMPLQLLTAGTENAVGFSLRYDPALVTLQSAALNPEFSGLTLNLRTNMAFPGVLGVALAYPPSEAFSRGTQAVMNLTFEATQTVGNTTLAFDDTPILREVVETNAQPVATEFVPGEIATVRIAPTIIHHPVSREVTVGESAVFAIVAEGSLPMSYQWRVNGIDIAAATNRTFSIVSAVPADAGNYAVRLSNIAGSVVSSNALLTVNIPDTTGPVLANPTFDWQPLQPETRLTRTGTLRLDATDASGVSRVEFYVDDTQIAVDLTPADGFTGLLDLDRFFDGTHTLTFKALDFRSNPAELSVPVEFQLAVLPPPTIGLPQTGLVTSNLFISVRGNAPAGASVVLHRNDARVGTPVPVDHRGIFETTLPLIEGVNSLQAATLNRAGESELSPEVIVELDTSLPAGPDGLRVTARSGGRVLLEWIPGTESYRGYHIYRASTSFTDRNEATRLTGTPLPAYTFDDIPPSDGEWHYRVTQVNLAGVEGLLSNEVTVEADRTPPTASLEYDPPASYDPESGRIGRGIVGVRLNLSEPVQGTPFLSFTLPEGSPILVELTRVSSTLYRGNFVIGDTAVSGNALAVFSARDRAGNRGDRILSGGHLAIDTVPPQVVGLAVQPVPPILNSPDEPVRVTVDLELSESLPLGAVPDVSFSLSESSPQPQPVTSVMPDADPLKWTVAFTLPETAGQKAETLTIHYQATDALGNVGSEIVPPHAFLVYQGDLPGLESPVGLSAATMAGGVIALEWQRVPEAADYALYRKTPNAPDYVRVTFTGNTNRWEDLPPADGIYEYVLSAVRRENGQESYSDPSEVAVAESDRQPPGMPTDLTLVLAKNGVFLQWTGPASATEQITYALYRSAEAPPADPTGLTAVIRQIPIAQVVDPAPQPGQPFYAVAAVDRAGNVSQLSEPGYLNIQLFPVQSLMVAQTNSDPPILTWTQVGSGVAGHEIFLGDATSNLLLNRRGLITDNRFIDVGYTGDERQYTIFTVDENRRRSPGRTLLLPALSATLDPEATVKRGLMNRLNYTVQNDSTDPLNDARLLVTLGGRVHASEPFWLPGQSTAEIPVIVGGYTDLPDVTAPLLTTIESHPEEGATVRWARTNSVAIGDGQLVIGVLASDLVRGTITKARFTLLNPSTEVLEVITATRQGNAPSSDIRMSLFNAEGQMLSTTPFLSTSGTNLVLLPDGNIVMRLQPGEEIVSQELDLPIPATVPNHTWIQVEVDRVFYHSDREDRVEMRGTKSATQFIVASTSYAGAVTAATPEHSRGDEPITISGRAWFRANRQPAPGQPLLVKIANGGFERSEQVVTDENGLFTTEFTPLAGEGGGIYSVWAVHPDLTDRAVQQQFVVDRVLVSPQEFTVRTPHYFNQAVPFKVTTGAGTEVTNLHLAFLPEDQPSGALPVGVSVDTGAPIAQLGPNQTRTMSFLVTGTPEARRKVDLVLRLVSGDSDDDPWATIRASCEFSEAYPSLRWSPSLVDTGMAPGSNLVEQVTFENVGLVSATNLFFSLHKTDGSPAPSWVALTTPPNLPELPVGAKALVGLTFRPPPSLAEDDYWFVLKTRSGNHPTVDLGVHAAVVTSGMGNLAFKVVDMYTGLPGNNGVGGASIRLKNQAVDSIEVTMETEENGEALFEDLPSGLYDYHVTVENHNSSNGRVWVRAGSTASEHVALAYSLVSVEWEVVPITIEDRYEIVLQAVFETDVPAPVVTIEPAAVNLPQLFVGDVFYGEFVVENHGLIRADNVEFQLPSSDAYIKYEILAAVPDRLGAKQKVRIPYRITCLQSFPGPRTPPPTADPALALARTSSRERAVSLRDDLPPEIRRMALRGSSGGVCFAHSSGASLIYDYVCINGEHFTGSAGTHYWYNYSRGSCGGGGDGGPSHGHVGGPGGTGGSGSSFSRLPTWLTGLPECCPPEQCEEQDQCDSKCCEQEGATCSNNPPPPFTPSSPGPNGTCGPDEDSNGPVALASVGGDAGGKFTFTNQLRCEADGTTYLDSDRRRLTFEFDEQGITTIFVGKVPYQYLDRNRTYFAYRANRIQALPDGFRWQNLDGKWEVYDSEGRLFKTGLRNLLHTRRYYDESDRLREVHDATGAVLASYTYNSAGQVTAITDRFGRSAEYDYVDGRLVEARDIHQRPTLYEYGADSGCGQRRVVTRVTMPDGAVQQFHYRSAGCDGPIFLTSRLDGEGNGHFYEQRYERNSRTYYLKITSTGGEVREKTFDSSGQLLEETVNGVVQRKILRSGRMDLISDAAGNETRRDHNEFGKVIREVAPDGGITTWEYDPVFHEPTRIVDSRGAVTLMSYDANGNLIEKIEAAGTDVVRTNSWVYNNLNQMLRHTDGRGNSMDYVYDDAGNLVREFDPSNPSYQTLYAYDVRSNRTVVTNALGHVTRYGYDLQDRLITETNALGHVTLYTYEEDNLVEVETGRDGDTPGRVVRYRYDDQGRRTQTLRVDEAGEEQVWETTGYDGDGRVITVANALGQTTRYEYDASGRRLKTVRPFSETETSDTEYVYDEFGRLTREIDPLGVITEYEPDEMGRQRKVTEALGTDVERSRTFGYDLSGNLTSITYSDGTNSFTTLYSYDLLNRRTQIRGAREYPKDFEYDANNNLIAEINGRGYRTEHAYDQYNRRTNTVEGIGHGEPGEHAGSFEYDLVGNIITAHDGNWNHRHYHHDALGRQVAESIPLASTNTLPGWPDWWQNTNSVLTFTAYNPWDQVTTTTNIVGAVTATVYDAFGRRFTHTDAAGLTLTNDYNAADQLVAVHYPVVSSAPAGSPPTSIRYRYSDLNNQLVVSTTDRANLTTTYGYNSRFERILKVSSWGATNSYAIDPLGRQIADTNALFEVTGSVLDQFDQLVATIHPDHEPPDKVRIEYRVYDEFGQITSHWGAATYDVWYEYDLAGNQVKLIDGNGNPTRWEYDGRNRKVRKTYADGGDNEYEYDANGNQISRRDSLNRVTTRRFNSYSLLSRVEYPSDSDVSLSYDALGRRTLMVDGTGTNRWAYDGANRIVSNAQLGAGFLVAYAYDTHGQRRSRTVTSLDDSQRPWRTHYGYEEAGRLSRIVDLDVSDVPFQYSWSSNALQISSVMFPSGARRDNRRDLLGRTTRAQYYDGFGVQLAQFAYTYNNARQRALEETQTSRTQFGYDDKRQLILAARYEPATASQATVVRQYAYDAAGNRQVVTVNGDAESYTANSVNQYAREASSENEALLYDANGALVVDGSRTFSYDEQGRLQRASLHDHVTAFAYDGLGRRVITSEEYNNKTYTRFTVYDGALAIQSGDVENDEVLRVVRGLDMDLTLGGLGGVGGVLALQENEQVWECVSDGRGNVRGLAKAGQREVNTYDYTPFGESSKVVNARGSYYGFASKEMLLGGSVVDYGLRMLYPRLGCWLTRDPLGETGGVSLYNYARNNSITYTDAWGLLCIPYSFVSAKLEEREGSGQGFVDWEYLYGGSPLNCSTKGRFPVCVQKGDETYARPCFSEVRGEVTKAIYTVDSKVNVSSLAHERAHINHDIKPPYNRLVSKLTALAQKPCMFQARAECYQEAGRLYYDARKLEAKYLISKRECEDYADGIASKEGHCKWQKMKEEFERALRSAGQKESECDDMEPDGPKCEEPK
ncbi:MAG: hypothetical protein H7A46_16905 [Verrucomicrobiales bacterium]|nr:hypothetical protein [Verrucomicrobiales bacterium]